MKAYYYEKEGQKVGPLSKAELKGKVSKDTLVWKDGLENWIVASQLPELKDLFQKEPPPLPSSEHESNDEIGSVKRNALLLFGFTIVMGIMEYFEWENNKFYGFMIMATVITTYYVLKYIKKYLNNVLNYTATNKDLNILIATSIILGVAFKFINKYESETSSLNLSENVTVVFWFILIIAFFMNLYYYFRLGKKLSKIGNEVASRFSKFAYTTLIGFVAIVVLSIMLENESTIILTTIVSAIPLLYLIIGFNNSKEQVRFV
ncbi:DUF4339 domain-containing protein [Lutibacter flavus]|uniref:GYF domain-containing protein n=1 Tax=Lutibacter flavus TaxID=691689 RepID=A0A238YWA7_9FLAO|nr:DUF4339 domain-containing protein [Lutibacter flavus]SNR75576.1 protein of unknown function [Lutibacter flavus]